MKSSAAIAIILVLPAMAAAQPVFYDDFSGPELLPHWSTPPAWHWDYNFNNSMLNITDLYYPNNPHIGGNWATIGASYEPLTDFRADIWMGWDPGDDPHRLAFHIMTATGHNVASLWYRNEGWLGPTPVIMASGGGPVITAPAPAPGIHQFTITRTGERMDFFLNNELFGTLQDPFGLDAAIVSIETLGVGALPGEFGTLYVDRVQVVPAPATPMIVAALALSGARRRRQ